MTSRPCRSLRTLLLATLLLGLPGPAPAGEKVFVYGLEGAPATLDPAKASSSRTDRVLWLACDTLLNASRDGRTPEPGLAESWTTSPDGRELTVRLRPGATFHDGTPVDAEAVKAGYERQFRPDHPLYTREPKNSKEGRLAAFFEEIRVLDPRTLLLRLKSPRLDLLANLEVVSPTALRRLGAGFGRQPVCSGPFAFESWTREAITLAANLRYWGGRPKLDRVTFRILPEGKAMVEALARGELDFVPVISDPDYLELVQDFPQISFRGQNVFYLGLATDTPPLDSRLVRQAIARAVDVPRLARYLGRGTATAARGPLPPGMPGVDPTVAQPPHDHLAARALLAQAGGPLRPLRLGYYGGIRFLAEYADHIKEELAHVGLQVELAEQKSFGELVRAAQERRLELFIYGWHVGGLAHPDRLLRPLFHSAETQTNLTGYRSAEVDAWLDRAAQLPEGAERDRLYAQVQRQIVEDAPALFLFHFTRIAAHAWRVRGLELRIDVAPHDKLRLVDLAP